STARSAQARTRWSRLTPRRLERFGVWRYGNTSRVRRVLLGGGYLGAVVAGGVASAQLWMHALNVDEHSSVRQLGLEGSQSRNVPALVASAAPRTVPRPAVLPGAFTG